MVHNPTNSDSLKSAWQAKYQAKKLLKAASSYELEIQQGDLLLAQNQVKEAIACYQRALNLDSNSTLAHQRLGKALKQQEKSLEADRSRNLAVNHLEDPITTTKKPNLSFNKNNLTIAEVYLQQAQTFEAHGEWQQAIAACQQALNYDSQLAPAYKTWGDNLQKLGNLAEAIGCYAQALILKPDYQEVCLNCN